MKRYGVLLSLLWMSMQGFTTLEQAQTFAQALTRGSTPKFDAKLFKNRLITITQARENIGFNGRFVIKLTPYPNTTFVVWGPVKGSFISFLETLLYIKRLDIIDSSFKLINPATYLVFNGDLVTDSDTSLETLSLLLALMEANPKRILYLRGAAEDNLKWQNNGVKKELKQKIPSQASDRIPLVRQMTAFFNTLPLALYITDPNPEEGSIRISYFSRDVQEIDETTCGPLFLDRTINVPQICYLTEPIKGVDTVKALIKGEQRLMSYSYHPGLTIVEPDKGAVTWSIFSAPSKKYQTEYQFYSNAFSIIKTEKSINDTTIALYNTDIRTPESIAHRATYNLLTGTVVPKKVVPTLPVKPDLKESLRSVYRSIDSLLTEVTRLNETLTRTKVERRTG